MLIKRMFEFLKNGCVVFQKLKPNNSNVINLCLSLLLRPLNRESQVGEVRCG